MRAFQRLAERNKPKEITCSDGSRWRLRRLAAGDQIRHGGKGLVGLMDVAEVMAKQERAKKARGGPAPEWAAKDAAKRQESEQAKMVRQFLSMPEAAGDFLASRDATCCAAVTHVWDDERRDWDPIQLVLREDDAHPLSDLEEIAGRLDAGEQVSPLVWIEAIPQGVRAEIWHVAQGRSSAELERFRGESGDADQPGPDREEVRPDAP